MDTRASSTLAPSAQMKPRLIARLSPLVAVLLIVALAVLAFAAAARLSPRDLTNEADAPTLPGP